MRGLVRRSFEKSKAIRRLMYETAPPGSLLICRTQEEQYVVPACDWLGVGETLYLEGSAEFEKLEWALRLLQDGRVRDLLIDVGANIGNISIPAVKRGVFQRAVAIEPEELNYRLLVANIHLNGLAGKMEAHRVAAGERNATMTLELSPGNFADHRIRMTADAGAEGEEARATASVECRTLDDLVGTIDPRTTLVWMDTQGFEGYVLAGARQMIGGRPALALEFWPYGMTRTGSFPVLKQTLLGAGYAEFARIEANGQWRPLSSQALDDLFSSMGTVEAYTDLIFR